MNKRKSVTNNHEPMLYGYARVSDSGQNIDRQLHFFESQNVSPENIYTDKQSGKNFNRPGWQKLFRKLKSGDTIIIKELDRLGRNKDEVKDVLEKLRKKNIRVKIANIPTTMRDYGEDDWILNMVNNILIEVLAAMAEQERLVTHMRQAEGIAAAHARGVRFGRPYVQLPDNFEYYYNCWINKKLNRAQILEILQINAAKWTTYVRSYRTRLQKTTSTNSENAKNT